MNDDDLKLVAECENVANGATDGKWFLDRSGSFSAILAEVSVTNRGEAQIVRRQVSSWGGIKNEGDARLAILARSAMPRLCTMVREQDKRARHAEQERDAFNARIDELEAECALVKEERDAVLEECDGCRRLAHLTPTHVPPIRTDRGSKWLCGSCLLSSFRALETQSANRRPMPTRSEVALALLRGIGPNPAEFMATGKDSFLELADRLIEMFDGKDKP